MLPITDIRVIQASRLNQSQHPVTTARYVVEFVINEEDHTLTPEQAKARFCDALGDACADGLLVDFRYDAMEYQVVSREVLDVAPAGDP